MTPPAIRFWIGLSGAVPDLDDLSSHGWSELDIRFMVARIAERAFDAGWGLVHGNHPTYRPIVERVAQGFGPGLRRVRIITTRWHYDDDRAERLKERHDYADVTFTPRAHDRPTSLTIMREQIIGYSSTLVCIGGRLHGDGKRIPGVKQEVDLALASRRPVFLLGGFGGFAQHYFAHEFASSPSRLLTHLDDDHVRSLATSHDTSLVLRLLFDGLREAAEIAQALCTLQLRATARVAAGRAGSCRITASNA